jgi:hypothetical protein
MSHSLASTSPAVSFRRWLARTWAEPDGRSNFVGVAGMIIFTLLLWALGPRLLRLEHIPTATRPHATAREFSIEIEPDAFAKPVEAPDPFKFVETNPDAPENIPDKTTNFAAQNQQVAQEKATPDSRSDRPAIDGKKDFESTQIVNGRLTQPIEEVEAVPEVTQPQEQMVSPPKAEQNPLTGTEKIQGEDATAFGSNVAKIPDNVRPVDERVEGEKVAPLIEGLTGLQPAIDPTRPRPRPQLTKPPQTRPAILADNKFGTENIGNIAVDAKWSNYGAYLQRMIDSVQIQWERILIDSKVNPPSGSSVTVKFVMNQEGNISRIVNVESNSSESARRACVSAITDRAPYGAWTDDMKALLGVEQEMTFTFYYQ